VSKPYALIVEDDKDIARLIDFHLSRGGFRTHTVDSGKAALERVHVDPPDVVLLDIMLPDVDGLTICHEMREDQRTSDLPIVMVSAKGEEEDVIAGLELGADDYIVKPFSPNVLIARVRAVMRRTTETDPSIITVGPVEIDHERRQVKVDADITEFTPTQYAILHFLAQRPGVVRTRQQIVGATHGKGVVLSSRAVDVHVAAVRQRLGARGDMIETVRGVGYRLAEVVPVG
jgi:two-component system phosphate regulon response regulator PhoB